MILFKEDWEKYPDAIVHYTTKNKTFLRYAGLLKDMGIDNNTWMLQLHNPLLKDVDPHDPNLTYEEKMMVAMEVAINPFYYFREIARSEIQGSPEPGPFKANRGNMALIWLFFNYITTYLIQIRQTGKSHSVNQLIKCVNNYSAVNSSTKIVTKDNKLREDNTLSLQRIESYLPDYLKRVSKEDMDSSEGITVKSLDNEIKIILAQKSVEAAKNLDRGSSNTMICIDEFPYLYNIDISLPVVLSTGSTAMRNARSIGQPAGIILYTSTGYLDTKSGAYAYKIYQNGAKFNERVFDLKDRNSLEEYVKRHSTGTMELMVVEMNHRALGYTDEWLRETIKLVGASKLQAMVEFMNIWVRSSTDSLLPKKLLMQLYDNINHSPTMEINNGFALYWHKDKSIYRNRPLIVSIDGSEMLDGDNSSLLIVDPLNGEVIARGTYGNANINEFGLFVFNLLREFKRSVLIIERKSIGMALLDQIATLFAAHNMNIFTRVFNTLVQDNLYNETIKSTRDAILKYTDYKKYFGFTTTGSGRFSRDNLYNKLRDIVELCINHIKDKVLIEEMGTLQVKKGRIDHQSGKHDDTVIAYLLAHWLMREGRHLEIYGLNPSTILVGVIKTKDKQKEEQVLKEQIRVEKIAKEIDTLLEEMRNASTVRKLALKGKLLLLKRQLDSKTIKTLNIDGRMREILANRR